jgi:hypothetical protein
MTEYERGRETGWNEALMTLHEKGVIDSGTMDDFIIKESSCGTSGEAHPDATVEELQEFVDRWRAYFLDFMNRTLDYQVTNPLQMRDLVDELSIQLGTFMGW